MGNKEYININIKLDKKDFIQDYNKFKKKVKEDLEYVSMTVFFKKQIKKYINEKGKN